ncbi:hypothetical protein [Ralstonia sp. 3PA37C10]|jgi:hypothetical protein|uniref:hypothetical protein n=1 Tax=unclassified Ralstonia TaxID=209769 RepID=UPI0010F78D42|nr:hypothetical protein [Ralstonia sp. 3PA37C10]
MAGIYVQWKDAKKTQVIAYFGAPQDPDVYLNFDEIEPNDPAWKTYFQAQPASVQSLLPQPE